MRDHDIWVGCGPLGSLWGALHRSQRSLMLEFGRNSQCDIYICMQSDSDDIYKYVYLYIDWKPRKFIYAYSGTDNTYIGIGIAICCGGHSPPPRYSRCFVCLVNVFPRRSFHRPLGGRTQNCAAHCSAPLALSPPWIRTLMVVARPGRMTRAGPVDTVIKFIDFTCLPTLSWTPPPRRIMFNVH